MGIYYFQTPTNDDDELDTCMVHVRERQREFKVEVRDDDFSPPILVITQGDRVWWEWKKEKVCLSQFHNRMTSPLEQLIIRVFVLYSRQKTTASTRFKHRLEATRKTNRTNRCATVSSGRDPRTYFDQTTCCHFKGCSSVVDCRLLAVEVV